MPNYTDTLNLYLPDIQNDDAQNDFFPGISSSMSIIDREIAELKENSGAGASEEVHEARVDDKGVVYESLADRLNAITGADPLPKPADYGAVGNGSTNDSAAFSKIEQQHSKQIIDLEGKNYFVSKIPTNNYYVNGQFTYSYFYYNSKDEKITKTPTVPAPYSLARVMDSNVILGYRAAEKTPFEAEYMGNLAAYANTIIGAEAMQNNNRGWRNTVVGFQAMKDNVDGQNNVAIGDSALEHNIGSTDSSGADPGSRNTAVGSYALRYNTTGKGNVAIGRDSAHSNETGNYNTAVGTNAYSGSVTMGGAQDRKSASYNTAVGYDALFDTNANDNIGIGTFAGYANSTGNFNVIIGNDAARTFTAGKRNVSIGHDSLKAAKTALDNVVVGNSAMVNLTAGNSNTAIGDFALSVMVDGTLATSINDCVGLGKKARVSGDNQIQLGFTGMNLYSYSALQVRSDKRDKADIRDTELGLEFIKKLRPVDYRFDYRDDYIEEEEYFDEEEQTYKTKVIKHKKDGSKKRSRFHHGILAQEVEEVAKEMGVEFGGLQDHSVNGGSDVYTVGYEEFISPMLKAIQELAAENNSLRAEMKEIREDVEALKLAIS